MQVTGNNTTNQNKILSIRLTPSGLYFNVDNSALTWIENNQLLENEKKLEKVLKKNNLLSKDFTQVQLSICTKDCMLTPVQYCQQMCELISTPTNKVLHSQPQNEMVEVFALQKNILDSLEQIYGSKLTPSSTMLNTMSPSQELTYSLAIYGKICCLVISQEGQVTLAQNLPCENHADILYYLSTFAQDANANIELAFDSTGELAKKLKQYYKNIKSR